MGAGREADPCCDAHGREFVGGTGVGVGFEIGFCDGLWVLGGYGLSRKWYTGFFGE